MMNQLQSQRYMGDKGINIWGMPTRTAPEFYQLPEAEPSLFDQMGGGGGGGMSFRMDGGGGGPYWNETMGVPQAVYEAAMTDRYANTVINAAGDRGYTGQGPMSRAGINAPGYVNNTPIQVAPSYYPKKVQPQGNVPGTPIRARYPTNIRSNMGTTAATWKPSWTGGL